MNYSPYSFSYNPQASFTPRPEPQGYAPAYQPQQMQNGNGFVCRPVTSRLEAEAVQVDFMGPGTIMPDLGHGVIYLKRFNQNNGASDFIVFSMQPMQEMAPVQYATIQDLNALRDELMKGKAGEVDV